MCSLLMLQCYDNICSLKSRHERQEAEEILLSFFSASDVAITTSTRNVLRHQKYNLKIGVCTLMLSSVFFGFF